MAKTLILLFFLFIPLAGLGLPPEGLESFAISQQKSQKNTYYAAVHHEKSLWNQEDTSLWLLGNTKTNSNNQFSFGIRSSINQDPGSRLAYFGRFDLVFWQNHSLSIKYAHEDWFSIDVGIESIGIELNSYFPFQSSQTGFYYSLGGYYRWVKQIWNENQHVPFTFKTDASDGFIIACIGYRSSFGNGNSWSLDFNNRDPFTYYNGDHVAMDFAVNFDHSSDFSSRFLLGTRSTALLTGTGQPATNYAALGLNF